MLISPFLCISMVNRYLSQLALIMTHKVWSTEHKWQRCQADTSFVQDFLWKEPFPPTLFVLQNRKKEGTALVNPVCIQPRLKEEVIETQKSKRLRLSEGLMASSCFPSPDGHLRGSSPATLHMPSVGLVSLGTLAQATKNKYLQLASIPCSWALRTMRATFQPHCPLDVWDSLYLTLCDLVCVWTAANWEHSSTSLASIVWE